MSYARAHALQSAVFTALASSADLTALVGSAVFDAIPAGPLPDLYVSLGTERVFDRSDTSGRGALHRFEVSVVSSAAGFAQSKDVAAAVCAALDTPLTLAQGHLVFLQFDRASARRVGSASDLRQIDLRFAARIDED